jgi:hypothetical protein
MGVFVITAILASDSKHSRLESGRQRMIGKTVR